MASGPSAAMAACVQRQQRGALHEIQHRQAGGEARRARGGQHMVGPGDVIAHRFGRVAAQEDRAGMAHLLQQRFRIGGGDLQMLGREAVGQRRGVVQLLHHDDAAIIVPAFRRDLLARQDRERRVRRPAATLSAKAGIVGDQDALRGGVMLGLAEQIGGDPVRIVGAIGDHQDFRRPGDGIDADLAEHFALGGRDLGIAGADDLVHRLRCFAVP